MKKNYNLECETVNKCKPIHYICRYQNSELISRILDIYLERGYDLECENVHKCKPIHYICYYQTPPLVNRILDIYLERGYDLECETSDNVKPIYSICRLQTPELKTRILNIYLEKYGRLKLLPLVFTCVISPMEYFTLKSRTPTKDCVRSTNVSNNEETHQLLDKKHI